MLSNIPLNLLPMETIDIANLFSEKVKVIDNLIHLADKSNAQNQEQTNKAFSEKWQVVSSSSTKEDRKKAISRQRKWHLSLYGFKSAEELSFFLTSKEIIIDAGCGLGEKSSWLAEMSPNSLVIGIDFSESVYQAAEKFKEQKNLYFVRGDIANTKLKKNVADYILCDQVIMHTEKPDKTFAHLTSILKKGGEFSCYVYRKKAVPRELLDSFFREKTKKYSNQELWEFSEQMTALGKQFSELKTQIDVPDIPLLEIKGGKYDMQRFLYWNFIKCFWNEELGWETSTYTNFDWYSPSNAKRYTKKEFETMIMDNHLQIKYFHEEEACFSGRFIK